MRRWWGDGRSPEDRRQDRLPAAIRIHESPLPEPLLDSLFSGDPAPRNAAAPNPAAPPNGGEPDPMALSDTEAAAIATDVWRASCAAGEPGQQNEGSAATADVLRRLRERLSSAGIEYQDHLGTVYDPGMGLDVAGWEPSTEYEPNMIIETLRPSVYRSGRTDAIQTGRVIVAKRGV